MMSRRSLFPASPRSSTDSSGRSSYSSPAAPDSITLESYVNRFKLWLAASEFQYLYEKGARIWIAHPINVWESAEIVDSYDGKTLSVLTESGETRVLKPACADQLPPLRNPDILIGENDLTALSYLHEPAVLYNLLVRFCDKNSIYTYCGIVLVAINPYSELPIYGEDTIWTYRGRPMGELDPHIFAIAEEAYNRIESEKRDQSIIVSGESGAGKTVSAKYVMRYFATVSGSSKETQVEKKVLASSPIMEAIGNAKTTRNDNSSRFGKYIELQFSKTYQILGASMRTYLLEKSRVVFQAPEERNYHIFYQLCAARQQFPELHLDDAEEYAYLTSESRIAGVDDEKCFHETLSALVTLGFSETDRADIFHILAGILFLGNIAIGGSHGDSDASSIKEEDGYLRKVCLLLELNVKSLRKWLCHRRIISMKETFEKPMSSVEARGARDALAKYMYAELFSWIVKMINRALETSADKHRFIGVLDIYGFETFEINSFEQFCINYANEKLQQQFNLHVFKLDQEEYVKEDIEWKFIDFYDNQPCIDLIETKLGVLDLLDEECRMPRGNDETWCEKLYAKCSRWAHFEKPRFGTLSFIVKHFADSVEYQTNGFLEKNKDTVIEEQVTVLRESGNKLLKKLFAEDANKLNVNHAATLGPSNKARLTLTSAKTSYGTSPASPSSKQNKKTVGSQFRDSLNALMATLNATTPHYIRCIKPNDFKTAFEFDAQRAVQQLRACGVLETIRISAAGFPSRILYTDFHARYKVLCKSNKRRNIRDSCENILSIFIKDEDKFKFGKTKIFFRAGQVALLERLRADKLKACCILIQKTVRGYLARKRYTKVLRSVKLLQRVTRGFLARRRVFHMRQERAALIIQTNLRRWLEYHKYQQIRKSTILIQTYGRAILARKKFAHLKEEKAATVIQASVRGWLERTRYRRTLRSVVVCQNSVRRFLARRELKALKREARSVEHQKKLNKGLENKIISLQQKIDELHRELTSHKPLIHELEEWRTKGDLLKNAEVELKRAELALNDKDAKIESLMEALNEEKGKVDEAVSEKDELKNRLLSETEELRKRCEELEKENVELRDRTVTDKETLEKTLRAEMEHKMQVLAREQNQDREAYQKLLHDKNVLEAQLESVERAMAGSGHHRSLSDASTISIQENSRGSPDGVASANPVEREDVSLVLKLQHKLKMLEFEKDKLTEQLDVTERFLSRTKYRDQTKDSIRVQELEIENDKLHKDLESLRKLVLKKQGDDAADEILAQFREMEAELQRRRDECSELRNVLVNHTEDLKSIAKTNYSPDADLESINEDGELVLALESQKKINRHLEEELQREKTLWQRERDDLKEEISRLKEDNDRQQQLLSANLSKAPQSQNEAYLQSEVSRLISEIVEARERYDIMVKAYRDMKKQLQDYLTNKTNDKSAVPDSDPAQTSVIANIVNSELPTVRKKERDYMGMFEFSRNDISNILKALVVELKPSLAMNWLPGLPAYIIFMCIRHTDMTNDEEKVRDLLCNFINTVKKTVKRRSKEIEAAILWFANTLRLMNTLKQYSGEQMFQEENTPTMNAQCLQSFDLLEYRQVLSDIGLWIYQAMIANMQNRLQDLALAAILEFEAIPGLSRGSKHLTRSTSVTSASTPVEESPDALQKQLSEYYRCMHLLGVDRQVYIQVYKQLFYFICATTLNNLLLRKELCHWTKGMQIRYNLSHLEQWARDQNLVTSMESDVTDMLLPIIQAAQLLQARKSEDDVDSICAMCNRMSANQIIKILNMYTPGDDYEVKVSMSFIKKIQLRLQDRNESKEQSNLLMDTKFTYPVRFPFCASDIRLEDVEIPDSLYLPMLRKV